MCNREAEGNHPNNSLCSLFSSPIWSTLTGEYEASGGKILISHGMYV